MLEGIGINDADYPTQLVLPNGKRWKCAYMSRWQNLFRRVYNKKSLEKYPHYRGCSVDIRWQNFMGFKVWMESQS